MCIEGVNDKFKRLSSLCLICNSIGIMLLSREKDVLYGPTYTDSKNRFVLNTSVPFHRVHRIFLVSLLKLKFKDAQTAAGLVERQVGNNILHNQIQSLINGDQVLKGNSCLASTSMLPRLLNCC